MFNEADDYPADACGGADFFSGAARRQVIDGDQVRWERIFVAERYIDADDVLMFGRPCVSEQTARHLGHLVGLVDETTVRALERRRLELVAEVDQLAAENLALKAALKGLEDTEIVRRVYIAPDGTEHASRALADRHSNPPAVPVPVTAGPLPEAP